VVSVANSLNRALTSSYYNVVIGHGSPVVI
jgi:hypothetical protein